MSSLSSSSTLQPYQVELINKAMACGALKFGQFTLKSGRISPYFFNAGLLSSGSILAALADAFASTIISKLHSISGSIPEFDVLFGPAYKGIPFAAITALHLHTHHNISVGFSYARKEVKDHGEGGTLVGSSLKGKKVVILDDVMTAGTAVREAINVVKKEGGEVVGVVQCLDREEVGKDGESSTVAEVEGIVGQGRVKAILRMRDLIAWLERSGTMNDELDSMRAYQAQYGLK
ncbi:hypothetical protein GYMLUDRAFT_71360 [Collybiopsis luxurians FD-317 M1]|uniref:orotate phosphoribosyltransferase n=1 Tax=Collybiopsis luxurians FD-317 M1 TaxID=944289 RepID=A0A0D0CLM2_9AGAR|nr:hypothetical protein GYMLUDRAFT_71360 [Collybiopsis luxurians FD-317 M1]